MTLGHNGGPPLHPRHFKKKWAEAIFSHPQKPMGAVAMAFKLYMEMGPDGTGAVVSDRDFSDACNVSERACQNFKRWLLDHGFVSIQLKGNKGRANTFRATIPGLTASGAANEETTAAPIAGNNSDERHPLPAIETGSPAPIAGNSGLTAPRAANAPPRAPTHARNEPPSGVINPLDYNPVGEVSSKPPAPARDVPHMNGVGFVISAKHDLIIPVETVDKWRARFPAIPDLEAQLEKLSAVILNGGHGHPAWTCPDGWMAGCLAQDNARALAANKPKPRKISRF